MAKNQAVEEVVPKADKLMYEAKETKNTIVTEWERSGDKDEMIQYSRKHSRQCILIVWRRKAENGVSGCWRNMKERYLCFCWTL